MESEQNYDILERYYIETKKLEPQFDLLSSIMMGCEIQGAILNKIKEKKKVHPESEEMSSNSPSNNERNKTSIRRVLNPEFEEANKYIKGNDSQLCKICANRETNQKILILARTQYTKHIKDIHRAHECNLCPGLTFAGYQNGIKHWETRHLGRGKENLAPVQ
jgi:hypothetical protein